MLCSPVAGNGEKYKGRQDGDGLSESDTDTEDNIRAYGEMEDVVKNFVQLWLGWLLTETDVVN